jgi:hypothetical protein
MPSRTDADGIRYQLDQSKAKILITFATFFVEMAFLIVQL